MPFTRPVSGEVSLPGSKSITNRALLLSALCDGPVTLTGALFSEDTRIMADALRRLGIMVGEDEASRSFRIDGQGGRIPAEEADIFVGNAGTAARFLTALCAAAPRGVYRIDGVPQMRKRPMKGLIEALRSLGPKIRCLGEEGFFPIEIKTGGLSGGLVRIDASESSQMLSALFMIAPLAREPIEVKLIGQVRWPFVRMTQLFMSGFGGIGVGKWTEHQSYLPAKGTYRSPGTYRIDSDATAASYFLALPLVAGGSLYLPNLRFGNQTLQGDARFAEVLRSVGLAIDERRPEHGGDELLKWISDNSVLGTFAAYFRPAPLMGVTQNFNEFSDTFLTLAAIAPLLQGPTKITGIAHTRKQETDRVSGMARELRKLGQEVLETEDSLEIRPRPLPLADRPVEIDTYGDHRFAMSFGILGCRDLRGDGRPWLAIRDPGCCAKTFPDFFTELESLRRKSLEA
jgi:3-phosphoshikimate 1-carboxyvinyltransferase